MDVREGFLCPICVQDLGSFHKLQQHFEVSHSAEDKAVFDQIKGLFSKAKGKAKGRFLKRDEVNESLISQPEHFQRQGSYTASVWDIQELGITRSYFEDFKKIRHFKIDRFVIESNKVLIRLDKLCKISGKANKKEFEQSLVPWVKDGDVPFCPTCGDRFYVARRKHHCRLCGAIMCKSCSLFISFEFAAQVVQALKKLPSSRHRTQSLLTVSLPSQIDKELSTRCCHECHKLLIKRKDKIDHQTQQPRVALMYEKLHSAMESAAKYSPEYKKMAESLNNGEEDYDLNKANEMRFKLMKLYETIDVISKKIASLDTNEDDKPPLPTALRLQRSIRLASHSYLQENMLTLQSLPSLPQLEALRKERRKAQEIHLRREMERVENEREEALKLQEIEQLKKQNKTPEKEIASKLQQSSIVLNDGWTAEGNMTSSHLRNGPFDDYEQDPIMEQIMYVKEMISQAKSAGRTEEVKSLSINLMELERESQQQRQASTLIPSTVSSPLDRTKLQNRTFCSDENGTDSSPENTNPFLENVNENNPFLASNENNPFL